MMRTKTCSRHRSMGLVRRLALASFLTTILLTSIGHSGLAQEVPSLPARMFFPQIASSGAGCQPLPGASYAAISVLPPPTDRPAEQHADLNLALRGYERTSGVLGLVDYGGQFDPGSPQLAGLFADNRTGVFVRLHRVFDWNWACNCRGTPLTTPPVTLAELATAPGETIHVPDSGYSIGNRSAAGEKYVDSGYEVLVLYATEDRLTLKYTRNDNVVHGFTLHLENICVDPALLSLYNYWNSVGRSHLPALRAGQAFGRARGDTIGVAIRDNGTFLDPRSRKDWWQGRNPFDAQTLEALRSE